MMTFVADASSVYVLISETSTIFAVHCQNQRSVKKHIPALTICLWAEEIVV